MKKENKKLSRHKVTFEVDSEQDLLVRASIGIGNRELCRTSGLSDSQVTYRLNKAKRILEMDNGFRVNWRNGNHPLLERVLRDVSSIMKRDIERDLVPKIVHPTPKTVKVDL